MKIPKPPNVPGSTACVVALAAVLLAPGASGQTAFTWAEIRQRFEAVNPTLQAAQASIDESRASEITAYLRPNPQFSLTTDGMQVTPGQAWRPFSGAFQTPGISYLVEREHKRKLRLEGARISTQIAATTYVDQERSLLFNLRSAFVQTLQAKAVLDNARENLDYWDHELTLNRTRFKAGDMAQVDLNRLELQRVQFESDYQTAVVNLRTSKIQLLTLLNDRTPIEQFDITGPFEFADRILLKQDYRDVALDTRPDLKAAVQNVQLAQSAHRLAVANGSTDPTFSAWYTHNSSTANPFSTQTMGGSITIPLRIFDRNQGEKARTAIDIRRNERLLEATRAQVFSDVDSAYETLVSTLSLLRPHKNNYLPLSVDVRDRVAFSYKNGGSSLLDYLDAEKSYRDTRLAYLNLIGSYLTAAAQLNMAAGREVIP